MRTFPLTPIASVSRAAIDPEGGQDVCAWSTSSKSRVFLRWPKFVGCELCPLDTIRRALPDRFVIVQTITGR
jgi:hypothetical protein